MQLRTPFQRKTGNPNLGLELEITVQNSTIMYGIKNYTLCAIYITITITIAFMGAPFA